MRKNIFLALAASSLLFCACGGDSNTIGGEPQSNAVQQITLQVASSGDGMTTRAGRNLESSEAAQDIQNVKVFVCSTDGTVKYVKDFTNWEDSDATDYANGREATFTIPTEERLDKGDYKVYAIGYSNESDYDLNKITSIVKGGTFNENAAISLKAGKTDAEEIFAGSADYKISDVSKNTTGTVVLNRQVAGTYGYVKDIPYVDGATVLELVASNSNSQLILGNFANADISSNGSNTGENVKYVVNGGTNSATENVIYSINLNDWFTTLQDADGDGYIDAGQNWKGNATKYANGSVFAGRFIIPFAKKDDTQTFALKLVKPGDTPTTVETWNVNLPAADGQLAQHSFTTWSGDAFTTSTDVTDTKSNYSVVRNHLYGIGIRLKATPDKPGEPGTDEPQSLKKAQNITLRVNDNWEVIHKMELE